MVVCMSCGGADEDEAQVVCETCDLEDLYDSVEYGYEDEAEVA